MPDYSQGKIYKIVNTVNDKVYIGSTTCTLAQRMAGHRVWAKTNRSKIYKAMRCHGVQNFKIELIKDYPCESKKQLEDREFKIIKKYLANGVTLYNTTTVNGKFAESTKRRMSKAKRGSGNNNYGKVGTACAHFKRGSVCFSSTKTAWRFQWQENGKQRSKSFSINKYGKDEAKRLVEEYRDKIYPID